MNPELLQSIQAAAQAGSLAAMLSQPWAICVPSLAQDYMAGRVKLPGTVQRIEVTGQTWEEYCRDRANEKNGLKVHADLGIAVQPVSGVMYSGASHEDEMWSGAFNTDRIARACEVVAADASIHTMVFRFNTPGGSVYGLDTAAKAITAMQNRRRSLNCVAWTGHLCASAGMYIAAACGSIHAAPSAIVGSIGTIARLRDWSGFKEKLGVKDHTFTADSSLKALGASPVTAEHIAHMEKMTALYSSEFKSWMKKRRGLKAEDMQGQYGEARHAPAGMVDSACFLTMEAMLAAGLA